MAKRLLLVAASLAMLAGLLLATPAQARPALEVVRTDTATVTFDNAAGTATITPAPMWVSEADIASGAAQPKRNPDGTVYQPRTAAGTLCPCGLYGARSDSATNSYGETIYWEFAVAADNSGTLERRFYASLNHNKGSGGNYRMADTGLMRKPCSPASSCAVSSYGARDWPDRINTASSFQEYLGVAHSPSGYTSWMSSGHQFWVRFPSGRASLPRQYCSQWSAISVNSTQACSYV